MQKAEDLVGHELKWSQPKTLNMEYECRDGDRLVATLRFRSSFGSFATAETGDGSWTFKRAGFFKTRVIIRKLGVDHDLAVFRNNTWANGGTLEMPDGSRFPANSNFWMTTFAFTNELDEPLVRYQSIGGVLHSSCIVEIMPAAVSPGVPPWLNPLGWYLAIMQESDSDATTSVIN